MQIRQTRAGNHRLRLTVLLAGLVVAVTFGLCTPVRAEAPRTFRWRTSRIAGTPDPPPPYKVEPAFPELKFARPLVICNAPHSDRLYVAEQAGKIFSFPNRRDVKKPDLVADFKQAYPKLRSVYGLAFHPDYARNRQLFVCFVVTGDKENGTRVARFKMKAGTPPVLDMSSAEPVISWPAGGHNGGCLKFGPDGYLYISAGDGAGPSPPDTLRAGQDVGNLLSTIMRIDIDQRDQGRAYRIPHDNPFVKTPGARGEIWAYGFRNPWKMSFDSQDGHLWVGDVGWELWEMIYRIRKGGNYGWSIVEGRQPVRPNGQRGPTPILPPTIDHPHSEAASITGGFVYRGSRLPELAGAYIYGDYQSGIVWGARMKGDQVIWQRRLAETPLQLAAFGEDRRGELYLLDHRQQIHRLIKNDEPDRSADFPRKLSETGIFKTVAEQRAAPGVLSYSINTRHWADHTTSERWLAIPGDGKITINGKGVWQFPDGAALVKTVSIETTSGDPATRRRLETQILHRERGSWRPYTYAWNKAQTDAALVTAEGFSRTLRIREPQAEGGIREQTYRFAGRQECALCHNPWVEARTTIFGHQSASPLGISLEQLNRKHGTDSPNQLLVLRDGGLLDLKVEPESAGRMADPYDESADLDRRARSYLHVNCFHCHQFNAGGATTIALAFNVKLQDARMLDARPAQGTFGIDNARIISPGDPHGSVLLYRLAKLGSGHMPRVGTSEIDRQGARLISQWIAQLPRPAGATWSSLRNEIREARARLLASRGDAERGAAIGRLTSSTRGAMALLQLVESNQLDKAARKEVLARTRNHPAGEVRDLFERFVPAAQRAKRLGTVVDQAKILNLEADVARGRRLFFSDSAGSCKNCHRIQKEGKAVGPDLTLIARKYKRDQLLIHILQPSRFMEPKYVPYMLETDAGRIYTGLLQKKTDKIVELRDAQDRLHRFTAGQVELLVPQQKSLMPELLLREMTAQQVADLLAYPVNFEVVKPDGLILREIGHSISVC